MSTEKLAFIDVETTGGSADRHKIIEIGIIRVENNKVTKKLNSLIDPDCPVPYFITELTGISDEDLIGAPSFYDLSEQITTILDGCVFVAHNAQFDYGFVKNEFQNIGLSYDAPKLCTVQLSRKLFPEQQRHNLDAVMQAHNLSCKNRHRAMDDANVIYKFFKKISKTFSEEEIAKHIKLPKQSKLEYTI